VGELTFGGPLQVSGGALPQRVCWGDVRFGLAVSGLVSGYTTPGRMTGVTLHGVVSPDLAFVARGLGFRFHGSECEAVLTRRGSSGATGA
jgi:hypothetical protein